MLQPIHPGEVLDEEFIKPMGLTVEKLAAESGIPVDHLSDIVAGKKAITADIAPRLAGVFGTTPEFWTNLQDQYNLICSHIYPK